MSRDKFSSIAKFSLTNNSLLILLKTMNRLNTPKRVQVIAALVDGMAMEAGLVGHV